MIIAVDEESGDVTRLDVERGSRRPGNHALGAVDDPALTEAVAADIGAQLAAAGITLDYAPAADVNNNPANPVIGVRSFGADPDLVARHTAAWIRGLQSTGVAACAKHFPGHGDTGVDSHHGLPIIEVDAAAARTRSSCRRSGPRSTPGCASIMTAHLLVPALDAGTPGHHEPVGAHRPAARRSSASRASSSPTASRWPRCRSATAWPAPARWPSPAGADAICVGGENSDEADRRSAARRASSTPCVERRAAGEPAGRGGLSGSPTFAADSAAAAGRAHGRRRLAGTPRTGPRSASPRPAARCASPGRAPPLAGPAHVVEFTVATNLAIEPRTPWGVGAPLRALRPDTTVVRLDERATVADVLAGADGRVPVLVCRDPHRHPWLAHADRGRRGGPPGDGRGRDGRRRGRARRRARTSPPTAPPPSAAQAAAEALAG